jgi:hypothetical protein
VDVLDLVAALHPLDQRIDARVDIPEQDARVLADRLVGRVAIEVLGAAVPRDDHAVE